MSSRFTLYYWPIPFRAQAIRYILTYAGEVWEEPDADAVMDSYQTDVAELALPFMGPPLLYDRGEELWLSQAPAITSYLGELFGLMPGTAQQDALTRKVISDGIDVLHALTLHCGTMMWTDESWAHFAAHRLPRWLAIFEELGTRHGLTKDAGTLLGTRVAGVADLTTAALWMTICDKLPKLESVIDTHAPNVLSLSRRLAAAPAIKALRDDQQARWGDIWCEGEIEDSLRSVLARWEP